MPTYQKSPHPTTASLKPRSSSDKHCLVTLLCQAGLDAVAERVARGSTMFWAYRCPNRHLLQVRDGSAYEDTVKPWKHVDKFSTCMHDQGGALCRMSSSSPYQA